MMFAFPLIMYWSLLGLESRFRYFVYAIFTLVILLIKPIMKWFMRDEFYIKSDDPNHIVNSNKIIHFSKFVGEDWIVFIITILYVFISTVVLYDVLFSKEYVTYNGIIQNKIKRTWRGLPHGFLYITENEKVVKREVPHDIYNNSRIGGHAKVDRSKIFNKIKDIRVIRGDGKNLSSWLYFAVRVLWFPCIVLWFSFLYFWAVGGTKKLNGIRNILFVLLLIGIYFRVPDFNAFVSWLTTG